MQGGIHSLHKFAHEIDQVHSLRRVWTLSPGLLEHLGAGHHGVNQRWRTGTARRYLADFHPTVQWNRCLRVIWIGDPGPTEHVDKHLVAVDGLLLDAHVRLRWILKGSRSSGPPMREIVRNTIDGKILLLGRARRGRWWSCSTGATRTRIVVKV